MVNDVLHEPTDSQKRYWQLMHELTVHAYYLQGYLERYQTIERRIKYFLAIMSSSAIASWAVWQRGSFFWAFLIAASQVVMAVQHLLPFAQREKIIKKILPDMDRISSEVEKEFFAVANGLMEDQRIHDITIDFKCRKNAIVAELDENVLPENIRLMEEAERKARSYFNSYYGG